MKGIIVSDFELTLKQLSVMLNDLKSDVTDLNSGVQTLSKHIKDNDLKFLTSKMDLELSYLKNVISKTEAYYLTLTNVLKSYQEQAKELANSINKSTF